MSIRDRGQKTLRKGQKHKGSRASVATCAEKDPMTCHRTILICRNLRGQNVDIQHIIDEKTIANGRRLRLR